MFGKKKFGLNEAKKLAKEKEDVSISTVLATLRILDVPNVVAQEVKRVVSKMTERTMALREEVAAVRIEDQEDEKKTEEQIMGMKDERRIRTHSNNSTIVSLSAKISKMIEEIEYIKSLEKYA